MITFLLKTSFVLIILLAFYKMFLEKESFFTQNRFYLLSCIGLTFILPFFTLPQLIENQGIVSTTIERHVVSPSKPITVKKEVTIENPSSTNPSNTKIDSDKIANNTPSLAETKNSNNNTTTNFKKTPPQKTGKSWIFWIVLIYGFGVAVFALNFISQIIGMVYKIMKSEDKIEDIDCIIINTPKMTEPCSFFNYIFINPESYDYDTYEQILAHEKIHVRQRHTFDLLLAELAVIVLWFNPLAWIYRKEIEKNIEYQTDNILLNGTSVERENYQMNLLKVATFSQPLKVTTNYNQSLIKQRILKMNAKKSNIYGFWKYAFIAPMLFVTLLLLNKPLLSFAQADNNLISDIEDFNTEVSVTEEESPTAVNENNDVSNATNEKSNLNLSDNISDGNDEKDDCQKLIAAVEKEDEEKVRKILSTFSPTCMPNADEEDFENFKYINFLAKNECEIILDNFSNRILLKGTEVQLKITENQYPDREAGFMNQIRSECKEFYKAIKLEDEELIKDAILNLDKDCIQNSDDPNAIENLEWTKEILRNGGEIGLGTVKVYIGLDELMGNVDTYTSWEEYEAIAENAETSINCKALLQAIRKENISRVKKLLKKVDPNCIDPNPEYASLTINGNAHLFQEAHTPLVAAARNGNLEIGKILVDAGAKVSFHGRGDETPLMAAAGFGQLHFVKYLLEKGAKINRSISGYGTAFNAAAREGHLEVVQYLLDNGAKIDAATQGQGTPLNGAARNGHNEVVKFLLANDANINAQNDGQGSALNAAARNGRNETIKILLAEGANINAQNDGQGSALNAAARNGHNETIKLLLAEGADINAQTNGQGSAINAAARNGLNETIKLLVENGANINLQNDGQGSPLNAAARNGIDETVKLLLELGANVNLMNDGQGSPLMAAARNGHDSTVKLLLSKGANINAINDGQGSALIRATRNSNYSTVKLLLDNGADPYLSRNHNESAADYAQKHGSRRMKELFEKYIKGR